MYFLLLFLFILPLHAEKIIQCIANFPLDASWYNHVLAEKGYEGKVVLTDIKEYDKTLLKKKGSLHKLLQTLGIDYPWKAQVDPDVDKIVFFNLTPQVCKRYDLSRLPKEKMILFMWEPKTVLEEMYRADIQACFSKIYTWDDSLVDNVHYFKFHYPVFTPMIAEPAPFQEKKLCTMISSDLQGSGPYELYSQRKEAIAYFERVQETGFEFYGRRWDPSLYTSYRGEIPDKAQVLKHYRFCLCYENTYNVSGYVTEKIFDCFAAGVVPIYWGASNIETYIPKECFIDRRHFDNLEDMHAFMKAMTKEQYDNYLTHIEQFLESEAAKKFTLPSLAEAFYQAVREHLAQESPHVR